ncbi:MAG: hypothetical protein QXV04_00790 [Desulfurococcaceae archaeon]
MQFPFLQASVIAGLRLKPSAFSDLVKYSFTKSDIVVEFAATIAHKPIIGNENVQSYYYPLMSIYRDRVV